MLDNLFCAESEGFEPPVRRNAYTTFRVWLFRPLRQLSVSLIESVYKGTAFFRLMQMPFVFFCYLLYFTSRYASLSKVHWGNTAICSYPND